jgi:methionine biosynthesis protein MetW
VSKYAEQRVRLEDRNSSTTKITDLVTQGARVLDVGCSSGYLGETLIAEKGARVWGVEIDESDAARARQRGFQEVAVADLDQFDWTPFAAMKFDYILFADVLEHLKNPGHALKQAVRVLARGGRVIASIPNVAHISLRLELLEGGFAYEEVGLLDDTHLKYFTRETIEQLFKAAGLVVSQVDATIVDLPDDLVRARLAKIGLEPGERFWQAMAREDARAYQYLVVAGRGGGRAGPIQLPIKTVMALARLESERKLALAEAERLRQQSIALDSELHAARQKLDEIVGSRSWKLALALRTAYRKVRPR